MTNYVLTDKMKLEKVPMTEQEIDLNKATADYIELRDARAKLKKIYEAKDQKLKDQMAPLEGFFMSTLQSLGAESVRTEHGTIYRSIDVKPACIDWGAFGTWIIKNEAIEALEKRVKKSFITEYMDTHKNKLPPGITITQEYTVTIRRK